MKRSTNRILTTHTGSLPRPGDLVEMLQAKDDEQPIDEAAFDARVKSAVQEIVKSQVESGVDIVSDGEMSKPAFATYVIQRLGGFGGVCDDPRIWADREAFPGWASQRPLFRARRQYCVAPLHWKEERAYEADIQNFKRALEVTPAEEAFLPSASPGIIADFMINHYYPTQDDYLYALAEVMKEEYQAIAAAGFILQIDAPDVALGRHVEFRNESLEEFRKSLAVRVAALNHALEGIPEEQVRFHVCWGNYEGPHSFDVPLKDIVDLVLQVHAGAYSIEASNPRHAHEWQVWEDVKLPDGKILIPGVIDSTTNFVEHPELVAQRIETFAKLVGPENVIAGSDCGFGTSAGRPNVHPEIVWAKFTAMADGARMATDRLYRTPRT
jgi:5-methyltetrahydropteroyltriglutamate--homocysteine methyltransferase